MSYGTVAGLNAYAQLRGITISGSPGALLVQSHDYLETLSYLGSRTVSTQDDSWPRTGVIVDGVSVPSSTVPQRIVDAEYVQAIAIDQGNGAQNAISPGVKREKVGSLEVEYQDGAGSTTIDVKTMGILGPYLAGGGGASNFKVLR